MRQRRARAIVAVLALGASSVLAQGVVDPRLTTRLDASTRTAVIAIIDSARARSLPVEPLIDKALEGAAKRATAQQIVAAVRTYATQLAEARAALGESSTAPEVVGGAQAIRAGISADQLGKLRRARAGVQIATALTVVSDLVAREVPIDTAVAVVSGLVRAAVSDEQLLAVRTEIETDILGGRRPDVAAVTRVHALEETLASAPPNGAGGQGTLPSPSGTSRAADGAGTLKPPGSAVGQTAPAKPPIQRKRP